MPKNTRRPAEPDLRRHPRLQASSRVDITWRTNGSAHETSGRCLDISPGGVRIEVTDAIPVSSSVQVRFVDDFNLEAFGVVRHAGAQGSIGIEFSKLIFCGSILRHKRNPLRTVGVSVLVISGLAGLVILTQIFPSIVPEWAPFKGGRSSSSDVADTMAPMAPPAAFFTLGSTRSDVLAVQGQPTGSTDNVWEYGLSKVFFRGNWVVGWSASPSTPLNVGANRPQPEKTALDFITVGATASDVLAVQGAPTELRDNVWKYGQSEVYFRDGRVVGWKAAPGKLLKVETGPHLTPGSAH
jgi:hypothetical protein